MVPIKRVSENAFTDSPHKTYLPSLDVVFTHPMGVLHRIIVQVVPIDGPLA